MIDSCILTTHQVQQHQEEANRLQLEINDLNGRLAERQQALQHAPPGLKPGIVQQIKEIQGQLHDKHKQLDTANAAVQESRRQLNFCFDYVRIHAVICSDDTVPSNPAADLRRADVTTDEITRWVNRTNQLYAQARIFFLYDPAVDTTEINNTTLNNYACVTMQDNTRSCDTCATSEEEANRVADQFPGKLVLFFRHGPGPNATGGGCSNPKPPGERPFAKFVMLPALNKSWICGVQNINLMAHEIGHFFGLVHTHRYVSTSIDDASNLFVQSGSDPDIFDLDKAIGIEDTPPDPFIRYNYGSLTDFTTWNNLACNRPSTTIKLPVGAPIPRSFNLPRNNIMSYYPDVSTFSPQQITYIRKHLAARGITVLPPGQGIPNPHGHDL